MDIKSLAGLWIYPLYTPLSITEMFKLNSKRWFGLLGFMGNCTGTSEDKKDLDSPVSEETKRKWLCVLDEMTKDCDLIGLSVSSQYLKGQREHFSLLSTPKNRDWLKTMDSFPDVFSSEADLREVFLLSHEDSEIFREDFPFGDEVHAHFPSASHDIKEAGKCLALDRNTACVMHLMRAVEVGLMALAEEMKVPYRRKSWEQIINKIPKRIEDLERKRRKPRKWPELRQFYSEAAERFRLLRDAYRNEVMHLNQSYGHEQAKDIYIYTKAFMGTLGKRIREKKIA